MDTTQWPQEIVVKPIIEEINVTCEKSENNNNNLERKIRTKKEEALKCPRCSSTNTKFCYYNNYSLTQPRYFCKTCRRYWTEGGSLRNIPVGGGSRKNKRSSSSPSSSSSINSLNHSSNPNKLPSLITPHDPSSNSSLNPILQNPNHDLNLAFPSSNPCIRSFSDLIQIDPNKDFPFPSVSISGTSISGDGDGGGGGGGLLPVSALELFTGISSSTSGLNPNFMRIGDPNSHYNTTGGGFDSEIGDFKPISLNFSLDGINNGSGYHEEDTSGRLLFPFEDLKQVSTNGNNSNGENEIIIDHDHGQKGDSTGYWSGMLGGNGSW